MPPNKTDEELANEFANHFLDKIEKIRSELTTTKPYIPKAYNTASTMKIHHNYWRPTIQGNNGHAH